MDCIFCDIANKVARAKIVYENDKFIAFDNIHPSAPVHVMLIPKEHIDKKDSIAGKHPELWSEMMLEANNVIKKLHLDESGYRIVNNGAGFHAIDHEHIHIMGGLPWRPSDNL